MTPNMNITNTGQTRWRPSKILVASFCYLMIFDIRFLSDVNVAKHSFLSKINVFLLFFWKYFDSKLQFVVVRGVKLG